MPWKETCPVKERLRFIDALESGCYSMTELCERFGISRKTGYKWAQRYADQGVAGLSNRSRAPKSCPHRTPEPIREALLEIRRQHPRWGPEKLVAFLQRRQPEWNLPAPSTVGDLLRREGLIPRRRRRRRRAPASRPHVEVAGPNDVWTVDFKGEFRTRDSRYCYPLTLADRFSRYLLQCQGLDSTARVGVQPQMERAFREYGLPRKILCDNGPPFGSAAIGGLSRLSVWWLKLGIEPVYIQPGHPEQNGAHERMHRTLKAETTRPPAQNLLAQQKRFEDFRYEYNELRPHEALGQRPPAEFYRGSLRHFPPHLLGSDYPGHFEVRTVRRDGCIKWRRKLLFLSEVFQRERVGLEEIEDGVWSVYFGSKEVARLDEAVGRFVP